MALGAATRGRLRGGGALPASPAALEGAAKFLGGATEFSRDPLVAFLPLMLLGVLTAWRKGRQDEVLVAASALALPILVFWIAPPRFVIQPRYFAYLLPLAVLLNARGVLAVARFARRRWGPIGPERALTLLALTLVLLALRPLRDAARTHHPAHRKTVAWIAARLPEGDGC